MHSRKLYNCCYSLLEVMKKHNNDVLHMVKRYVKVVNMHFI